MGVFVGECGCRAQGAAGIADQAEHDERAVVAWNIELALGVAPSRAAAPVGGVALPRYVVAANFAQRMNLMMESESTLVADADEAGSLVSVLRRVE